VIGVISQHVVLIEGARRRAASLVGTLRPGRESKDRTVAGTLVANLLRQQPLSPMLLAHRRQREADPPPGSQRDKRSTVSPGAKGFHAGTLEIAMVCEAVFGPSRDSPLQRFRGAAAREKAPFKETRAAACPRGESRSAGAPPSAAGWEKRVERSYLALSTFNVQRPT
jgi:hypothetical protein